MKCYRSLAFKFLEQFQNWCISVAPLKRLREKLFLWRSSRFAGCALAFGRVELFIFNGVAARLKSCPDTRLHTRGFFPQLLKPCPDNHGLPRVNWGIAIVIFFLIAG